MERGGEDRVWFWTTLVLSCITTVALVFVTWELVEHRFFRQFSYQKMHFLYITRGVVSSFLLAAWATWFVLRQRKRSEDELRHSRERYLGILRSSPEAIVLLDPGLRVVEWNPGAERLYGYECEEVVGQILPTIPPERSAEVTDAVAHVGERGRLQEVESQRKDRAGQRLDVGVEMSLYRDASGQEYILEVSRDIRERIRLRQRALEIEKLATMGKIAAGIAHHMNTPLAAMLLRVEMMRDARPGEQLRSDLERIEKGIRACQQFVQRLLHFAHRGKAKPSLLNLGECVQSTLSFLEPSLRKKNLRLECVVSAPPTGVLADPNDLEALLSILVMNAFDAVDSSGQIWVRVRAVEEERVELMVADNGSGIRPEIWPHLFEPFFTTKGPGRGTGLGLPLAKGIVEQYGGTIGIEPRDGGGTQIRIQWPLANGAR